VNLSEAEKMALRQLFPDRPGRCCDDCGGYHLRACPRIKREVKLGNGNRTEVEYWASWDDSNTVWPEDVFSEEDE
jgi:hypothetical protein